MNKKTKQDYFEEGELCKHCYENCDSLNYACGTIIFDNKKRCLCCGKEMKP